jgi:hypothetical protein
MQFNEVFGQLKLTSSEVILSGSHSNRPMYQTSFFSLNYRDEEATLYDAQTDRWLATGWNPYAWYVTDAFKAPTAIMRKPTTVSALRPKSAIA